MSAGACRTVVRCRTSRKAATFSPFSANSKLAPHVARLWPAAPRLRRRPRILCSEAVTTGLSSSSEPYDKESVDALHPHSGPPLDGPPPDRGGGSAREASED